MKTGRPRKPSALKLLEGNWRPDTQPRNEPQPNVEIPDVPDGITEKAQEEWNRITVELECVGLLSRIDKSALAMYCEAYATSVYASLTMQLPENQGGGMVVNGKISPWYTIWERAAVMVHRFSVEFGMTPASRSRINVLTDPTPTRAKKNSKNYA